MCEITLKKNSNLYQFQHWYFTVNMIQMAKLTLERYEKLEVFIYFLQWGCHCYGRVVTWTLCLGAEVKMIYEGSRNCYIDQPAEFTTTLISFLNSLPAVQSAWFMIMTSWLRKNDVIRLDFSKLIFNVYDYA